MARAALPGRLSWQLGRVVSTTQETVRAKSLVLEVPRWPGHRAGQHVDIRLTAEDGYQAQRGYSIASAPDDEGVTLTVDRLEGGEVSPYLTDVLEPGDKLELRGPIGGYFVWDASLSGPLLLISGGSGIVPLRAMLRHWAAVRPPVEARLLHSAPSLDDVIYRDELLRLAAFEELDVRIALTRAWPEDWLGHRGRIDRDFLRDAAWPPRDQPRIYACGPTAFVEATAAALVDNGQRPDTIKTERFGPTGG
jgi:ferredoxin-NADP reductase